MADCAFGQSALRTAFPGCGAARSGAPLIRDRSGLGVCYDPGSATHHFAPLRAALRPGNESLCGFCAADGTGSRLTVRLAPNFVSLNPDYACYLSGGCRDSPVTSTDARPCLCSPASSP